MKKLILLLSVITLSYASIGKISAIRGNAKIITNGVSTKARLNQELNKDDIVKTGNNARLQIIFNDNTVTTLGKNTTLKINDYLINGKKSKVDLEINEGSFKVITGEISKLARKNFKLKAHTATIGIRGTVFVGEVGLNINKLACLQGAIDVKVNGKFAKINSGKQISYNDKKILKIEAVKIKDFSITHTTVDKQTQPENIKKEDTITNTKVEDSSTNTNPDISNTVSSVVLGSTITSNKNIDNSTQQEIEKQTQVAIEEKYQEIINESKDEGNNNGGDEGLNKPEIPSKPIDPSLPYNKYFNKQDLKRDYYYGSENYSSGKYSISQAKLNISKGMLDLYSKTSYKGSIEQFKHFIIDSNAIFTSKVSLNNGDDLVIFDYHLKDKQESTIDGNSDYVFLANIENGEKINYKANKDRLSINIMSTLFELNQSNKLTYNEVKRIWENYEKYINNKHIEYFKITDKERDFFYSSTLANLKLNLQNPTITYYFINPNFAKKLDIDLSTNKFIFTQYSIDKNIYDEKTYIIAKNSVSNPYGGKFIIDSVIKNPDGSSENFNFTGNKNYVNLSLGELIKFQLLSSVGNDKEYFYKSKTLYNGFINNYKEKYFTGHEIDDYYYSSTGSAMRLNPSKSEFEGYLGASSDYSLKIVFDKNNGQATYLNHRIQSVGKTSNHVINNNFVTNPSYRIDISNKNLQKFNVTVKADKSNANVHGTINIQGDDKSFNVTMNTNPNSSTYKQIKNKFDALFKQYQDKKLGIK